MSTADVSSGEGYAMPTYAPEVPDLLVVHSGDDRRCALPHSAVRLLPLQQRRGVGRSRLVSVGLLVLA
eukprot:1639079-Rhodomonas_salina.4